MSLTLANRKDAIRKDAIRKRLTDTLTTGYGSFDVRLVRACKHQPRTIKITWVVYPFEDTVRAVLGDIDGDDVTFERRLLWSCGGVHDDEVEAWKAHEGEEYLVYPDYDGYGCAHDIVDKILPADVEEKLRANGETFGSACVPGSFIPCPTCGGSTRVRTSQSHTLRPCSDCARLGLDRQRFPGILDLTNPEHRNFYQQVINAARAQVAAERARAEAKRTKALAAPTTHAAPTWVPLPTRAAGIVAGIPVSPIVGCDYLTHADDEEHRACCSNQARWFDHSTGLRVCAMHKKRKASDPTGRALSGPR